MNNTEMMVKAGQVYTHEDRGHKRRLEVRRVEATQGRVFKKESGLISYAVCDSMDESGNVRMVWIEVSRMLSGRGYKLVQEMGVHAEPSNC